RKLVTGEAARAHALLAHARASIAVVALGADATMSVTMRPRRGAIPVELADGYAAKLYQITDKTRRTLTVLHAARTALNPARTNRQRDPTIELGRAGPWRRLHRRGARHSFVSAAPRGHAPRARR